MWKLHITFSLFHACGTKSNAFIRWGLIAPITYQVKYIGLYVSKTYVVSWKLALAHILNEERYDNSQALFRVCKKWSIVHLKK